MKPAMFRGTPTLERLTVHIHPKGWRGMRPELTVCMEHAGLLTFYVREDGAASGWLTVWGINGPQTAGDVTADEVSHMMGWTK